jgi:hypothetical protein
VNICINPSRSIITPHVKRGFVEVRGERRRKEFFDLIWSSTNPFIFLSSSTEYLHTALTTSSGGERT